MNRIEEIKEQLAIRNAKRPPSPPEKQFGRFLIISGLKYIEELQLGFYFIDFALPEYKLAIEIDSKQFHSSEEQIRHDAKKDEYLKSIGWDVLRLKAAAVNDPDTSFYTVKTIYRYLQGEESRSMEKYGEKVIDPILYTLCSYCDNYHRKSLSCKDYEYFYN